MWNQLIFSYWYLWKQDWTHPLFFFFFLLNMLIKGERISFRSWPIGYDKLVTPITLGTSELSKWWDHISVWCLYTQSVLRCCLSISLPICVSPCLLHLTVSHKGEERERWGSVTIPRFWLIYLRLLALRYQGDWHLKNASVRWKDRYGERERGGAVLLSLNWSWRAKASQEERRWNGENARAGQWWQLMPLPPATRVTLSESFDPRVSFPHVQIKLMIRFIYFPFSFRNAALSCAVSPRVFTQGYECNTSLRTASVLSRKTRTSMRD